MDNLISIFILLAVVVILVIGVKIYNELKELKEEQSMINHKVLQPEPKFEPARNLKKELKDIEEGFTLTDEEIKAIDEMSRIINAEDEVTLSKDDEELLDELFPLTGGEEDEPEDVL